MTIKKVTNGVKKIALWTLGIGAVLSIGETTAVGTQMAINDVEFAAKTVAKKVDSIRNPIVMKKKYFWSKPEPYNPRTKTFVADIKKIQKSAKKTTK